ncbi:MULTISPECIES: hypothetical protein [unclassified Leifsonia]|uniref:hypothetical protein n=1 Tax=unclassified Leifsonia TaxID=2663824 RepID=UPI001E485B5E|nr:MULTISPECIES: hypothetical protein [unclassified Leifsonia]
MSGENAGFATSGGLNVELDGLAHLVLHQADDDWLEIGNPNYYAGFFEHDLERRSVLVLSVVRALAEAGYLRIGELSRDSDHLENSGWVEWTGTLDEQMDRLAEVYKADGPEDDWYWACWLQITDAGRAVVEVLPNPAGRFFRKL